jgi:hypothetical protein
MSGSTIRYLSLCGPSVSFQTTDGRQDPVPNYCLEVVDQWIVTEGAGHRLRFHHAETGEERLLSFCLLAVYPLFLSCAVQSIAIRFVKLSAATAIM